MEKGKGTMGRRSVRTSLALPANRTPAWIFAASVAIAAGLAACGSAEDPNGGQLDDPNAPGAVDDFDPPAASSPEEEIRKLLDQRTLDYGEALRTASLKLRDRLPDLAEIKELEAAKQA